MKRESRSFIGPREAFAFRASTASKAVRPGQKCFDAKVLTSTSTAPGTQRPPLKIGIRILALSLGFGALLGSPIKAAAPILRFPDGISWKAVFDAGLRPKHVPGLERKMTECRNQPLRFELEGSSEPFILDPGRLSIELRPDDSVRLFMHTSHVPISMEEGERRLETFRRIFDKHLIRKGWMPPVMDERGSVMTSSEQAAAAKIGVYGFTFGFTGTSRKDFPLIARFQLAWVGTGKETTSNIRRKIVVPPPGYVQHGPEGPHARSRE